ncbi:MAG TPA: aminotransferase class III-fold pyridoxal phosphate-dependent enzyme [Candidatus Xenobia bacterium]
MHSEVASPPAVSPLHLGPEFEAIAERYGFMGGARIDQGYALPEAEVPADVVMTMCEELALHARRIDLHIVFDPVAETLAGFQTARRAFRRLWQALSVRFPQRFGRRPPGRVTSPHTPPAAPDQSLPHSQQYLERAYRSGLIPADKQRMVIDFRTSSGMFLSSIDADEHGPLCVLADASSQVGSIMTGFNMPGLQGVVHHPEAFLNPDYRTRTQPVVEAFRRWLSRQTPSALPHVCFVNSGSEAVEKALGLALRVYKGPARRVLAFEGSSHGRTLLSVFSTWRAVERQPFEMPGFESVFVDYPENHHPHQPNPWPRGWLQRWHSREERLDVPDAWLKGESLLAREVASLVAVRTQLLAEEVFAVLIEPFQGEGGDRYITGRFLSALRVLTRTFKVPLIFDEVEAGMGLSGRVFWYQCLGLRDRHGEGAHPDFLCLARKAQSGLVLSCIPDPDPTAAHLASILRGYYNAQLIDAAAIRALEAQVWARLTALADQHALVQYPRARGLAFAFDVPDAATAETLYQQRFARGCLVCRGGDRTVRYRLQVTTTPAELDTIFQAVEESVQRAEKHGARVAYEPSWPDPPALRSEAHPQIDVAFLDGRLWREYQPQIMAIEEAAYQPAHRDTAGFFETILGMPRHVALVALLGDVVVGFTFAGPLEYFAWVRGCDVDPEQGHNTCLFSADVTVAPAFQGQGIGQRLKDTQLAQARAFGYRAVRSRNPVGVDGTMGTINRAFGAIEVAWLADDYGEEKVPCLYSSIPVQDAPRPPVDWSNGIEEPTGARYLSADDWEDWDLAAVHKLMGNWMTPNYVRYVEWLLQHAPAGLVHLHLSNGRDEAADNAIKTLRFHRPGSNVCIAFEGGYWGHTTAGARSLSAVRFRPFFPWPRLPYPYVDHPPQQDANGALHEAESQCLDKLTRMVTEAGRVVGIFIEPLQEMTGRWVSVRFLKALRALCTKLDIPLVFNETASWAYRAAPALFYCQSVGVEPDALVTYAGGQVGHTLVNERYLIAAPLAMASTWEGDELSCLRLRSQLRYVEACRDEAFLSVVDERLKDGVEAVTWRGTGRIKGAKLLRRSIVNSEDGLLMGPLPLLATQWENLLEVLSC